MSRRRHYNKRGKYIGYSEDKDDCTEAIFTIIGLPFIILLAIIEAIIDGD